MLLEWNSRLRWSKDTTAILASGPSMSQQVADSVRGRCNVIAVNDTFRLAPWADMLYAADFQWWNFHKEAVATFKGLKATLSPATQVPGVMLLKHLGEQGASFTHGYLKTGKNSGFQAMQIAAQLGAKNILLCGFDMRKVDGKAHYFGNHPTQLRPDQPVLLEFLMYISNAAPQFERHGHNVVNCTKGSALTCFKSMPLETALESFCSHTQLAVL